MMAQKEIDYVFNFRYFKFIKKLQWIIGLWPYQSPYWSISVKIFVYSLFVSYVIPLCNGCKLHCGVDLGICGENIGGILYAITVLSKYFSMSFSEKKLIKVYEQLATNWLSITDPDERDIMVRYAEIGKLYSIIYIVYLSIAAASFSHLPAIPVVLDILFPLNQSRSKILFVKVDLLIDPHEHYGQYYMYFLAGAVSSTLVFTSVDATFCIIVHQIVGIVSVTKHRLLNATKFAEIKKDNSYNIIVTAISLHQDSIKFVQLIEASFTVPFFILVLGSAIFLSLGSVVISNSESSFDTIRFILIEIGAIFQVLYLSLNAQKIIDCSNDLYTTIWSTEWYNISTKSKNLLKFMMMRTTKPLLLTAGGFYIMSVYNFGMIMKTAMSYTTVLSSFK